MDEELTEVSALPDWHFRAAHWWFSIGNPFQANDELGRIEPRLRNHPEVLRMRWQLSSEMDDWTGCLSTASTEVSLHPDRVEGWIHQAIALHRLNRTSEAISTLLPMVQKFPTSWKVPYNLACFCTHAGRIAEAKGWFSKSIRLHDQALFLGMNDPDLHPLLEELE